MIAQSSDFLCYNHQHCITRLKVSFLRFHVLTWSQSTSRLPPNVKLGPKSSSLSFDLGRKQQRTARRRLEISSGIQHKTCQIKFYFHNGSP